jgi:uncharacterized repeat protein (TIGR03803 family)
VVLASTLWLLGAATGWTQTSIELVLHSFTNNPDGILPIESLVAGVDNAFYGITIQGGTNKNGGTLYKLNPDGTGYKILHYFGTSDTGTGTPNPPYPALSVMPTRDGTLYGTTYYGGTNGDGSIFELNSDGSGYNVVHSFSGADSNPSGMIQGNDGEIYGTTASVVFRFDPSSGNYTILHTFSGAPDGALAFGKLIQANDGALYGTTYLGGTNNDGSVYKITTNGNTYAELYAFTGFPDGAVPYAGVIQGNDGMLYGTTRNGGTKYGGTVYKLNLDGSSYKVIANFNGSSDGGNPLGSLVESPGNVLYGTTSDGGAQNIGAVFALNPDGSGFDVLYNFSDSPDGCLPDAGLTLGTFTGGTGALYGTTYLGGSAGHGSLYAILINPPLSITPVSSQTASNQTVVFWPVWALNYTLQSTTNLTTGTWVSASNGVPVSGLQLTNSAPAMFYRLLRQ